MTPEEKAKRYDETLEQLKGLIEGTREDKRAIMEEDIIDIFYELKESEDEKIRKALIEHIKSNCATNFVLFQKFSPDDVIAWLEKQSEQKSTWSEEDEKMLNHIIGLLEGLPNLHNWLKSLKDRIQS